MRSHFGRRGWPGAEWFRRRISSRVGRRPFWRSASFYRRRTSERFLAAVEIWARRCFFNLRLLVLWRSPVFRRSLSTNGPRWGTSRVEVSVLENQAAPSILPCSICSRLDTRASCGLLQDCGIGNKATVADPRSALTLVARRGADGRIRRASVAEQLSAAIAAVTLDKHPWTLKRSRRFCSRRCLPPGRNI